MERQWSREGGQGPTGQLDSVMRMVTHWSHGHAGACQGQQRAAHCEAATRQPDAAES